MNARLGGGLLKEVDCVMTGRALYETNMNMKRREASGNDCGVLRDGVQMVGLNRSN